MDPDGPARGESNRGHGVGKAVSIADLPGGEVGNGRAPVADREILIVQVSRIITGSIVVHRCDHDLPGSRPVRFTAAPDASPGIHGLFLNREVVILQGERLRGEHPCKSLPDQIFTMVGAIREDDRSKEPPVGIPASRCRIVRDRDDLAGKLFIGIGRSLLSPDREVLQVGDPAEFPGIVPLQGHFRSIDPKNAEGFCPPVREREMDCVSVNRPRHRRSVGLAWWEG